MLLFKIRGKLGYNDDTIRAYMKHLKEKERKHNERESGDKRII